MEPAGVYTFGEWDEAFFMAQGNHANSKGTRFDGGGHCCGQIDATYFVR